MDISHQLYLYTDTLSYFNRQESSAASISHQLHSFTRIGSVVFALTVRSAGNRKQDWAAMNAWFVRSQSARHSVHTLGQLLLPWWLDGDTAPVSAGDINSQVPEDSAQCLLLRAGGGAAAWRHHHLVFSRALDAVTSENITIFTSVRDQKKCYNAATMFFFLERIL